MAPRRKSAGKSVSTAARTRTNQPHLSVPAAVELVKRKKQQKQQQKQQKGRKFHSSEEPMKLQSVEDTGVGEDELKEFFRLFEKEIMAEVDCIIYHSGREYNKRGERGASVVLDEIKRILSDKTLRGVDLFRRKHRKIQQIQWCSPYNADGEVELPESLEGRPDIEIPPYRLWWYSLTPEDVQKLMDMGLLPNNQQTLTNRAVKIEVELGEAVPEWAINNPQLEEDLYYTSAYYSNRSKLDLEQDQTILPADRCTVALIQACFSQPLPDLISRVAQEKYNSANNPQPFHSSCCGFKMCLSNGFARCKNLFRSRKQELLQDLCFKYTIRMAQFTQQYPDKFRELISTSKGCRIKQGM